LERLFTPDLFILGGGASKEFEDYGHLLKIHTPVTPAKLLNNAGIVGAALYAIQETE
jgi:polyphosphate glucokinase